MDATHRRPVLSSARLAHCDRCRVVELANGAALVADLDPLNWADPSDRLDHRRAALVLAHCRRVALRPWHPGIHICPATARRRMVGRPALGGSKADFRKPTGAIRRRRSRDRGGFAIPRCASPVLLRPGPTQVELSRVPPCAPRIPPERLPHETRPRPVAAVAAAIGRRRLGRAAAQTRRSHRLLRRWGGEPVGIRRRYRRLPGRKSADRGR